MATNNYNITVYTSIIGGRDKKRNDILCFESNNIFRKDRLNAKIYKVLPHLYLETNYSIWVDGNVILKVSPETLIHKLGDKDIAVFNHIDRDCIYDEAKTIIDLKLDDKETVIEQINRYKQNGYMKNQGIGMCFMIIRKHTNKIARLNERWWAEICRGSSRDQLSFPYVFRNEVQYLDWEIEGKKLVHRSKHKSNTIQIIKDKINVYKNN
jgi:hypothetical protein